MRPRYDPEIRGAVFRAARSLGYQIVDSNSRRQTGETIYYLSVCYTHGVWNDKEALDADNLPHTKR